MLRTISSSELRTQIKRVLNEVGYGDAQYIVEKFGEPTAAIINMEDFRFLQAAKREQATSSLQKVITGIRERNRQIDPNELNALIEEARTEFYQMRGRQTDAH